jgi:hypothetical protein
VTPYPHDTLFLLRLYAPSNQGGGLLVETWHRTRASFQIELAVMRSRILRGEASRIEAEDCITHRTETYWD